MRHLSNMLRTAVPLAFAALILPASVRCRAGSTGFSSGRGTPNSFSSARSGPHRVGHAPGTCDLCDLYYKARSHVVRVRTEAGLGAGIVMTEQGLVLTSAHVTTNNSAPILETYGEEFADSKVMQTNADLDLAVLQPVDSSIHWEPISMELRELPEVGSDVYVIGHPVGLGWTVTRGVVSATRRAGEVGPTILIQTDAAISPGNSGGPLLNRHGQLLGIVSSKLTGPGIESVGFAIPVSVIDDFLADSADSNSSSTQARTTNNQGRD